MSPDQYAVIKRIRDELTCPIDWEGITSGYNPGLVTELWWFWKDIAKKYDVDDETRHVHNMYYQESDPDADFDPEIDINDEHSTGDDLETLRAELRNIAGGPVEGGWIELARKEYKQLVDPLVRLKIADDNVYKKHYLPANILTEQRLKLSKQGTSFLYAETEPLLERIMWWTLDDGNWRRILFDGQRFLYAECPNAVGATKGLETRFLKFDFDISTPQAHAYPIAESEIPPEDSAVYYD